MQTYQQALTNGQVWQRTTDSNFFYLLTVGANCTCDVSFYRNNALIETAAGMDAGFWTVIDGGFDRVDITANGAQTVKYGVHRGSGGFNRIAQTISIMGTISLTQQTTLPAPTTVVVGTAATAIVAADATRKCLRLLNEGTAAVRLGGAGVTMTAPMVLNPGAYYEETNAAAAAWYAISGAAGQNVRVQEVKD